MVELEIEAPLAQPETEDWIDLDDIKEVKNSVEDIKKPAESNDNSFIDNFSEAFSDSLEDLVNTFDEKIANCFYNYDEDFSSVPVRDQEGIIKEKNPIWWKLIKAPLAKFENEEWTDFNDL